MRRVANSLVLEAGKEAAADEVVDEAVGRAEGWGHNACQSEEGARRKHGGRSRIKVDWVVVRVKNRSS